MRVGIIVVVAQACTSALKRASFLWILQGKRNSWRTEKFSKPLPSAILEITVDCYEAELLLRKVYEVKIIKQC